MPVSIRYVCRGCHKIKTGGTATRWCDDCGGELKKISYKRKRKAPRAR